MNDEQLLRYSRQIMLPQIDIAGQLRILHSRVLIVGLGGLGSPVAMYLATAGVGTLVLCDHDTVELSNLQRQIVHQANNIGGKKVDSAKATLSSLNPGIEIQTISEKLQGKALHMQISQADVVVDCSDNFDTRFQLNDACVLAKTPLVSGAAIRFEGQVSVFRLDNPQNPCYRCLYRGDDISLDERCSETGILAPIAGVIGSIQAVETLKILTNVGCALVGRLLIFDGLHMEIRTITLKKDPLCPTCSAHR